MANPELAGQFEVELDRGANLRRLRELYRAGDVMKGGVLFPSDQPEPKRAVREMTLLAGAAQAYWIVSGKLQQTRDQTDKADRKSSVETTVQNLVPPIAGLLSGVLRWLGDFRPLRKQNSGSCKGARIGACRVGRTDGSEAIVVSIERGE